MDIRRSKIILKLLDKNSIVLNDLDLNYVWLKKKRLNYLSNFLKNNQKISYKNLIESNMMGMTNTAMTIKTLKKSIKFLHSAKKAKVFDWYYWSKSLQSNYAIFTNKTSTKYNIFHNSKNKIPPDEDFKSIKNLLRVKENFYYLMADDKKIYKTKFLEYRNFLKYIKLNNLKNINNLLDYKRNLWWSINIKYEY